MMNKLKLWLDNHFLETSLSKDTGDLLVSLCAFDTSLKADIKSLKASEQECLNFFAESIKPYLPETAIIKPLYIHPEIEDDEYFTKPYYAGSLSGDYRKVYHDRFNLLIDNNPDKNQNFWLLNAHVDTVAPHIPPTADNEKVYGRGSVDDKGGMIVAFLVAKFMHGLKKDGLIKNIPPLKYLISIDEEMGGNGSLSAALDLELENAKVVVMEPTDAIPFPANRGAIWFQAKIKALNNHARSRLISVFKDTAIAFAKLGYDLKTKSHHPLFSNDDIQTCFGILNRFGHHPSSACMEAAFKWQNNGFDLDLFKNTVSKTLEKPTLKHFSPNPEITADDHIITLKVSAKGGHMGSRDRDSDALIKSAEIISALEQAGFGLPLPIDETCELNFEGGQGFLPDTKMADLQNSMLAAFNEIFKNQTDFQAALNFDKLHNQAFCSSNNALGGKAIAKAFALYNATNEPPLNGWKVSCDARIFARACSDVTTFGAGRLETAHSPDEFIAVNDIIKTAKILTLAILSDNQELLL